MESTGRQCNFALHPPTLNSFFDLIAIAKRQPQLAVILFTACSLVAAMTGALIVHKLTRSRDHAIWVRDSTIKEWQELLEELTKAYMILLRQPRSIPAPIDFEGIRAAQVNASDHHQSQSDALADVDVLLSTRIFIADEIELLGIRQRWAACVEEFVSTKQNARYRTTFQSIRDSIVATAKQTN